MVECVERIVIMIDNIFYEMWDDVGMNDHSTDDSER